MVSEVGRGSCYGSEGRGGVVEQTHTKDGQILRCFDHTGVGVNYNVFLHMTACVPQSVHKYTLPY